MATCIKKYNTKNTQVQIDTAWRFPVTQISSYMSSATNKAKPLYNLKIQHIELAYKPQL